MRVKSEFDGHFMRTGETLFGVQTGHMNTVGLFGASGELEENLEEGRQRNTR